jgi:hypothetical protein
VTVLEEVEPGAPPQPGFSSGEFYFRWGSLVAPRVVDLISGNNDVQPDCTPTPCGIHCTCTFVFIGAGTAAVIGHGAGFNGIAAIGFAHGLTMACAFAYGSLSGGHMNPAVTISVLAAGAMRASDVTGPHTERRDRQAMFLQVVAGRLFDRQRHHWRLPNPAAVDLDRTVSVGTPVRFEREKRTPNGRSVYAWRCSPYAVAW